MGAALGKCASLRTLDVADNNIDASSLRTLFNGVRAQYSLTALDVSSNRFADEGASMLAQELRTNPALCFLRVADGGVGEEGGAALAEALADSANGKLILDASRNSAIAYADLVKMRMSNNRRWHDAGLTSPLDGMSMGSDT